MARRSLKTSLFLSQCKISTNKVLEACSSGNPCKHPARMERLESSTTNGTLKREIVIVKLLLSMDKH
jgi:hypothetical protein